MSIVFHITIHLHNEHLRTEDSFDVEIKTRERKLLKLMEPGVWYTKGQLFEMGFNFNDLGVKALERSIFISVHNRSPIEYELNSLGVKARLMLEQLDEN